MRTKGQSPKSASRKSPFWKLRYLRHKLRRKNKLKALEQNEAVNSNKEIDQEEDSLSAFKFLVKNTFKFLITFTTGLFNLMNSQKGVMWGLIQLALVAVTHGSPVVENDATTHTSLETLITSIGPNPNFTLYPMKSMEASSFIFQLNDEEFYESHTMETGPSPSK